MIPRIFALKAKSMPRFVPINTTLPQAAKLGTSLIDDSMDDKQ